MKHNWMITLHMDSIRNREKKLVIKNKTEKIGGRKRGTKGVHWKYATHIFRMRNSYSTCLTSMIISREF